jgi:hypothetical protein
VPDREKADIKQQVFNASNHLGITAIEEPIRSVIKPNAEALVMPSRKEPDTTPKSAPAKVPSQSETNALMPMQSENTEIKPEGKTLVGLTPDVDLEQEENYKKTSVFKIFDNNEPEETPATGQSPLIHAIQRNKPEIARKLILAGASLDDGCYIQSTPWDRIYLPTFKLIEIDKLSDEMVSVLGISKVELAEKQTKYDADKPSDTLDDGCRNQ